ncbi:hypothetical protein [Chitinophaga solisilvae]|uniref:hypothetical protein n=1 Tax=Chitinophaga solisilvae TaxID=1233460 RepID=UPI001369748D|nr:hypothetical protein [Chitinophaga solisilvae]
MQALQEIINKEMNWDDMRLEFGKLLGMTGPVPSAVLKKAIDSEKYASYLISASNNPKYLELMFNMPADVQEDKSNLQVLAKAASSLLKWGKSGFGFAPEEVFEKRFSACVSCEYLREAPDKVVYKLAMSKQTDDRICSACGCVASRKARLRSESCPVRNEKDPSLNRWGEAIAK